MPQVGQDEYLEVTPASAEMIEAGSALSSGLLGKAGAGVLGAVGAGSSGVSLGTVGAVGAGVVAAGAGVAVAVGGGGGGGSSSPVSGSSGPLLSVADGRISGATVYADSNGNGVYEAGIDTTVVGKTGADGTLQLTATATTALFAVGGTNIDTGLANTLVLSTAAGSSVINPITTLIAQYVASGATQATAEAAVKAALGLSSVADSLLTYDPLTSGNVSSTTALAVQKAAVALATAATNAESLGQGDEFMTAVMEKIKDGTFSGSSTLDLSDSNALTSINGAMGTSIAGLFNEIERDVRAVQSATTLNQTGEGSLTLAQEGALDSSIQTFSTVAAAAAANLAEGKFNLEVTSGDILAHGHDATVNKALNIVVTNDCTAAEALEIEAFTNLGATSLTISDTVDHLVSGTAAVDAINGAVDVIAQSASISQLAIIDAATTGHVSALAIEDTAAHLAANAGGYVHGDINVTVSGAATLEQLATIDGLTGGDITYTAIADTAAHLAANPGGYVQNNVDVTVTGDATVTQLATIDGLTGGPLHYTTIADSVEDLLSGTTVNAYVTSGVEVVITNDATAEQIALIDAANGNSAGVSVSPALVSAAINGDTATLTFSTALDASVSASALISAIHIDCFGESVAITDAHISGTTVTLTLDGDVHSYQEFTVSYTDPTAGDDLAAIQNASGYDARSFSNHAMTNNTPDGKEPVLTGAALADGTHLTLAFTEALDATNTPDAGAFHVTAGGSDVTVNSVSVSGHTVTLELGSTVAADAAVTVSYNDPSTGDDTTAIQDAAGNDFGTLDGYRVTTGADYAGVKPVVVNVSGDTGANTVAVDLIGAAAEGSLSAADFTVTVNGAARTVSGITYGADSVEFTISGAALHVDDVLNVQYTGSALQGATGLTYVDTVDYGESAYRIATEAAWTSAHTNHVTFDHADSLWVDYTPATAGMANLGTLDDMGSGMSIALGHNALMGAGAASAQAYTVDLGDSTFTTLSLFGTGDHVVTLNDSVNTVVIDESQNGGSTLDFSALTDGHQVALDFSDSPDFSHEVGSASLVQNEGDYAIVRNTGANTCDITYMNGGAAAVLHLTNLSDSSNVEVDSGLVTVTNQIDEVTVADGRISGAVVYADGNHDGIYEAGTDTEQVGTTDNEGVLHLTHTPNSALFAVGGTNIDTNLANTLVLSTSAGSEVINPITTLIQQYATLTSTTSTVAEAAVKAALGLGDVTDSLLSYDPLTVAESDPTNATALEVQKVAVSLATATAIVEDSIDGSGTAFMQAIATKIEDGLYTATNTVDLTMARAMGTDNPVLGSIGEAFADISGHTLNASVFNQVAAAASATLAASSQSDLSDAQNAAISYDTVTVATVGALTSGHYNLADTVANILNPDNATTVAGAVNIQIVETTPSEFNMPSLCTAQQALALTTLGNSGTTYFEVTDTYANLTNSAYAAGIAAAGWITIDQSADSTPLSMAQLKVIDDLTTATVSAQYISDTATNLLSLGGRCPYIADGSHVTITGEATVAQITALAPNFNGNTVHQETVADTLAHINASQGQWVHSTTNVHVTDAVTVAQLATLDAATATVTADNVSGSFAQLSGGAYLLGTSTVHITGTVTAGQYDTINAIAGTVTADTISVSGAASLAQLTQLDAVSDSLSYGTVVGTLSGLAADLAGSAHYAQGHAVIITDTAVHLATNGDYTDSAVAGASLANLQSVLAGASSVQFGGTVYASVSQIQDASLHITGAVPHLEITDTVSLQTLEAIDAKITGTVNAISISGTADELLAYAGQYVNSGTEFVITGEYSQGQYDTLNTLNGSGNVNVTGGTLTATTADGWAPHLLSATVGADGKTIVLTYDEAVSDTTPATSAFGISKSGEDNSVSSIDHTAGSSVMTLHLSHDVHAGQTLTLSYDNNTITDGTNHEAAVNHFEVTNNYDDAAPQLVQAFVTGAHTLVLGYDDNLAGTLNASDYSVTIHHADASPDTVITPTTAAIDTHMHNFIDLDLGATTIAATDTITVSYSGSGLHDATGNASAALTQAEVVNSEAPVLADMSGDPGSGGVYLDFGAALDINAAIQSSDFTVTLTHAGSTTAQTLDVALAEYGSEGHSVHLLLGQELQEGDTLTVSYSGTSIVSTDGHAAGHFTSIDAVAASDNGYELHTQAAFTQFESSGALLSHSDSLWVDFSGDAAAGATVNLGALHNVNSDQTLVLGHETGWNGATDNSSQAYHVDLGTSTFTSLTLGGTGEHAVTLNNSVNEVVVNDAQGNLAALSGSTLDFSNVAAGKHIALDVHNSGDGLHVGDVHGGLATSYDGNSNGSVDAAGEYTIETTANGSGGNNCNITYFDSVSNHAEILHLTNLSATASVGLTENDNWVQVTK
jgi:uncharacterized repeat protein (TIGR02059 family)